MLKTVRIYLASGLLVEDQLEVADDAAYAGEVNGLIDHLRNNDEGAVVFTSPSLGIYRYRDIAGIQFADPPPDYERPPMGFLGSSK